jgi:3-hydroxyacyl-[acyl-carrier-protein] dehydratase
MERLDAAAIQRLLPHRHPFLLVDTIDVAEPGRHVIGRKLITADEWWMQGASPDAPCAAAMPHLLVLESLAQVSGALVRDLLDGADQARAYFMGAGRVRFREMARAGDELVLDLTLLSWRRGICRARGVATVRTRTVVSAELSTVVRA